VDPNVESSQPLVRVKPEQSSQLPPIPRDATAKIRRRAWLEPRVRFWWMAAAVLLIAGLGFVAQGIMARFHDAWLIQNGVRVDAIVMVANGEAVKNKRQPPDSVVEIQFPWHDTPKYSPRPRALEGRSQDDWIVTRSTLPIKVNPDNPEDWTWLDAPVAMLTRMVGGIVVLPIALLALAWAIARQRLMLKLWREGEAIEALIVETRNTAIAPRSRVARVTPSDDTDRRMYTVYLPATLASLRRGDAVVMIRLSNRAKSALAAAWVE
jgi:hypothetical protein